MLLLSPTSLVLAVSLLLPAGAGSGANGDDLTTLSLEELLDIQVTVGPRRRGGLGPSSASIHVITREDLLRSGYTRLSEFLRAVPDSHRARLRPHRWAAARGGKKDRRRRPFLVMIDGRPVATRFLSGLRGDAPDLRLQDIERIEVFRRPRAATGHAAAVAGVIEVTTRFPGVRDVRLPMP